jgi:hypothetical protein
LKPAAVRVFEHLKKLVANRHTAGQSAIAIKSKMKTVIALSVADWLFFGHS